MTPSEEQPKHFYVPDSAFYTFGEALTEEELSNLAMRLAEVADEFGLFFGGGLSEVANVEA